MIEDIQKDLQKVLEFSIAVDAKVEALRKDFVGVQTWFTSHQFLSGVIAGGLFVVLIDVMFWII